MDPSIEVNGAFWDERAAAHAASPDYAVARFADDPTFLSDVVRFDRPRLGDITASTSCTCSATSAPTRSRSSGSAPASPASTCRCRRWQRRAGSPRGRVEATFVRVGVYDAVEALGEERFDLVFTGIGALCWLPDIRRWAQVVAGLLRPGGRLHIREGHPVLWSLATSATTACCDRVPLLRDRRAASGTTARRAPTCRPTRCSHQRHARVEPRPGRDRDRAARRRDGADDARGARLGAVGRDPRRDEPIDGRVAPADRPAPAAAALVHAAGRPAPA